ncbi:MAG: acyltransferase, partial [Burkholderiaceae bacterium]|nr:acyltransferase [Burkholderiaceae bacterium]
MSSAFPYPTRGPAPANPGTAPDSPPLDAGHHNAIAHRADIEGLRGIAVLSVLAVHSFPALLRGGFIGVDIFFVLSGYLISTILFRSVDQGRFSLLDFYARRVRRIYPALCLVLTASLAFSLWFTFPSASRHLGHHVAAGALFLSNIALWNEAGYFDVASEAKPLLHLWSLGIEEQFYIVWPLAVVVLTKYRRHALTWIVLGLVLSFALNIALVADKPKATFFLPPTRFWELMVGALLAYLTLYRDGPVAWLRHRLPEGSWVQAHAADVLAWSGMAMLVAALGLIDKTDHFPGWWAGLPTLGTFALIAAGSEASANRRVLCQPILRMYGTISYPLYLWHWPLLSFPVVLGIEMTTELRIMILVA